MNPDDCFAVILAGGSGTRFWPKSRQNTPKQLCVLGAGETTMLEQTLSRLDGFIPAERRIIVTHQVQVQKTRDVVGSRAQTILAEPEARNTAAALTLAALHIKAVSAQPDPVMISLHADHQIGKPDEFIKALSTAAMTCRQGFLTLLGVVPTHPATGFGYIESAEDMVGDAHRVLSFREKPDLETANTFLAAGNFFWNAGIFIWTVADLIAELKSHLPDTLDKLQAQVTPAGFAGANGRDLRDTYKTLDDISIDHALLEKSERIAVVPADIDWYDVGAWDSLGSITQPDAQGNIALGDVLLKDCQNTVVDSDGTPIAVLGMSDVVIVSANGAILVLPKSRAQEVKSIVEAYRAAGRTELL